MMRTAEISECGRYRYRLTRRWDESRPAVMFVMLNPSTADACQDDRTISRCIGYARDWGYGELLVGNLFALRSADRGALRRSDDPVGPDNDAALLDLAQSAALVIAAWGDKGAFMRRNEAALRLLPPRFYALKLTQRGHPGHPLYLPSGVAPFPYSGPEPY